MESLRPSQSRIVVRVWRMQHLPNRYPGNVHPTRLQRPKRVLGLQRTILQLVKAKHVFDKRPHNVAVAILSEQVDEWAGAKHVVAQHHNPICP